MQVSVTFYYNCGMATEKFIHGKVDEGHHDGLYANTKRLEAAVEEEREWSGVILGRDVRSGRRGVLLQSVRQSDADVENNR